MVWGESNSREFLDWADYCRDNALKSRNITKTGGINFTNDKNHIQFQAAKVQLLDIIQKARTISVQQLYNDMPTNLLSNPTIKHVILQLYFEDNLTIQGQTKNNSDRETNFVLTFVKKQIKPKEVKPVYQGEKKQSNIEDLIDNSWSATGRKLGFDKKEKPSRENLNISLKRTPKPTINTPGEKPVIDVRQKVEVPKKVDPIVVTMPKEEAPKVEQNITYIQIPKPKPEIIEPKKVIPAVKINPEYRPQVKEEVYIEDKVFYGLSAYELYYLGAFLSDAFRLESTKKELIKSTKELVYTKADINYLTNKEDIGLGYKIVAGVLCLIVVGAFMFAAANKNKIKKSATKDYNKELKQSGYDKLKTDLKIKYPNILMF
ncbi:hypothetical protein SGLAD_v1c09720 [Spiroplasma gladiatoris]|uniref:Uncharacterized protein n=1 Tax=Spiroplasma gladiatoris TaxID=2143 RepID=A0A4P7AJ15_9MOLU|nr:hypothetical protein [Spiroplasma gladiatoris]QBQ08171.1 hypothetical protein SGLAD_v1c09720 [Spiroplasma gladiatoris]